MAETGGVKDPREVRPPSPEPVPHDDGERPGTPIDLPPQEAGENQDTQEVDDGAQGAHAGGDRRVEAPLDVCLPSIEVPVIYDNGETPSAGRTMGVGQCVSAPVVQQPMVRLILHPM